MCAYFARNLMLIEKTNIHLGYVASGGSHDWILLRERERERKSVHLENKLVMEIAWLEPFS